MIKQVWVLSFGWVILHSTNKQHSFIMSWIQAISMTYLLVDLTVILWVVTVIIYQSNMALIFCGRSWRRLTLHKRWCSNGPLDTPLGPGKMKYSGATMEPTTTNPQGCSITRTSMALPLITKPHLRAKLANTHINFSVATLSYIISWIYLCFGAKRFPHCEAKKIK